MYSKKVHTHTDAQADSPVVAHGGDAQVSTAGVGPFQAQSPKGRFRWTGTRYLF